MSIKSLESQIKKLTTYNNKHKVVVDGIRNTFTQTSPSKMALVYKHDSNELNISRLHQQIQKLQTQKTSATFLYDIKKDIIQKTIFNENKKEQVENIRNNPRQSTPKKMELVYIYDSNVESLKRLKKEVEDEEKYLESGVKNQINTRVKKIEDKLRKSTRQNQLLFNEMPMDVEIKEKYRSSHRVRRQGESHALGNYFHTTYIEDDKLTLAKGIPNQDFIKKVIIEVLTKQFVNLRSSKVQLNGNKNKKNYNLQYQITSKIYVTDSDGENENLRWYNMPTNIVVSKNQIKEFIDDEVDNMMEEMAALETRGSGFAFDRFHNIIIKTFKLAAATGSSYIELPLWVTKSNTCVNIRNEDDKCFYYCLVSRRWQQGLNKKGLPNKGNLNNIDTYKKYFDSIVVRENQNFPVSLNDIPKFELDNKLKINVFEIAENGQSIIPVYHTKIICEDEKNEVNLLLIHQGDKSHYVLINNLRGLIRNKSHHTKHLCTHCLEKSFLTEEKLNAHKILCYKNEFGTYKLPNETNNILEFINHNNKFEHHTQVFVDFECTLQKIETSTEDMKKKSIKHHEHIANSYGMFFDCIDKKQNEHIKIENNSNPEELIQKFVEDIERLAHKSYKASIQNKYNIIFNKDTNESFKHSTAKICTECKTTFTKENSKVAHHNHVTGKFISTLCSKCNLKYKCVKFLPVVLHNLKKYDAHIIIKGLYSYGQKEADDSFNCIPNSEESFLSFSKKIIVDSYHKRGQDNKKIYDNEGKPVMANIYFTIKFIDSMAFLPDSLNSLVENLKTDCMNVSELRTRFKNMSEHFIEDNKFQSVIQKGIYPYDHITTFNVLHETKLPTRKQFYSMLNDEECKVEDYEQAEKVWNLFECKTLLEYHNIYLTTDVLLLADVWNNFREMGMKNYKLDCNYYVSAPGFAFDAMLLKTGVKLELYTDYDMYLWTENKGIRGGISQVSKRYAEANNKYMKAHDSTKEISHILNLDANALYPAGMVKYLPVSGFKMEDEQTVDRWTVEEILAIKEDADIGYTFEFTIRLPKSLHDKFNNYPMFPRNMEIDRSELSKFQQENCKVSNAKKLCLSLNQADNYVAHYRYLQTALKLGYELVKIHKVQSFNQSPFMKPYIEMNTDLRKNAKSKFEEDFFKYMNNSVFGKTMENVRKRISFRLVSTEEQAGRIKNLDSWEEYNENLVGINIKRGVISLNKPIYLGACILDDSKAFMTEFHYNVMIQNFGRENIDLLFTDTDSLCYHIRHEDPFKLIKTDSMKEHFDFSNYPKDHELYDGTNKKVLGKFKNVSVDTITEIALLRSKLYAYKTDSDNIKMTCAGIRKSAVSKQIRLKDYKNIILNKNKRLHTKKIVQQSIMSQKHVIYTERQNKIALNGMDDKVYICENNIDTLSFGHYQIELLLSKDIL